MPDQPPSSSFQSLGVSDSVVRVLTSMGIVSPTPIQRATLADSLSGKDVLGQAPTGSGKTIAFGIPIVEKLGGHGVSVPQKPRALIISPTRELSDQIADVLAELGAAAGLRTLSLVGGDNVQRQQRMLAAPVDIAVVTPGRAHDLKRRGLLSLDAVELIVIDEADMLADLGFYPEVLGLVRSCPASAQRLLFSATLNDDARALLKEKRAKDAVPAVHKVSGAVVSVNTMRHLMLRVADNMAADEIVAWLASRQNQCVIFANSKQRVVQITKALQFYDIKVDCLHGDRGQAARRSVLAAFDKGDITVLVATDIAARGIDIDKLDLVVHADPPFDSATYVHRSGRTARAGQSGTVAMIVRDQQVEQARNVLAGAGVTAEEMQAVPGRPVFVKETGARRPRRAFKEDSRDNAGRNGGGRAARGAARGGRNSSGGSRPHRPKRTKKNRRK